MELLVDIRKKLSGFTLDVKLEVTEGILGLLGESGSGKSMTLSCIAGIVKPDEGKIILNGRTLFHSEKKINLPIKDRKIGFLFQNYALFPHMNVENNIGYGLQRVTKSERSKIINEKLEMLQLHELRHRYPHELSGGQQQRVALARALAVKPEALFLDEPFSALDNHLRSVMVKQMIDTLKDFSGVTLFVTHNMEEAYQLCDKIAILSKGKESGQGDKQDIFRNPPTLAAAKVTGCKNISPIRRIDCDYVEALDWGCKLRISKNKNVNNGIPYKNQVSLDNNKLEREIDKEITHIGIRAHYLEMAECSGDNIFNCWPAHFTETPFRRIIFIKLHKEPLGSFDHELIWDISAEEWEAIRLKPLPWRIKLNQDKFILINEKL